MRKFLKAVEPHFRNSNRSKLRWNSIFSFSSKAPFTRDLSAYTEWSMTKSTGHKGLIRLGSPPKRFIASRMAARSTTAGTPVKSYRITRAGLKGISILLGAVCSQFRIFCTSFYFTANSSQLRTAFSNNTRTE